MFDSERFSRYNIPGFWSTSSAFAAPETSDHPYVNHLQPGPSIIADAPTTSMTTCKRDANDDLDAGSHHELNKRVKLELHTTSPMSNHDRTLTTSTMSPTLLATPQPKTVPKVARSTADDFMGEFAATALDRDWYFDTPALIASKSTSNSSSGLSNRLEYNPSDVSHRNSFDLTTVSTASASDQIVPIIPSGDTAPAEIPPFPIEAIGVLQQTSTDMLRLLVKKNAPDRERQLQAAVGTMRICLEVDFVPHLDAWAKVQAKASAPAVLEPVVTEPVPPPVDVVPGRKALVISSGPKDSSSEPRDRVATPPLIAESNEPDIVKTTREALQTQLSEAMSTIDKLRKDIRSKDKEYDRVKADAKRYRTERDEDYVSFKKEIKGLKAMLESAEAMSNPKPCGHAAEISGLKLKLMGRDAEITGLIARLGKSPPVAQPKPCGHLTELAALKGELALRNTKIKNQTKTANELLAQTAKLKMDLKAARSGLATESKSIAKGGKMVVLGQSKVLDGEGSKGSGAAGEGDVRKPPLPDWSALNPGGGLSKTAKKKAAAAARTIAIDGPSAPPSTTSYLSHESATKPDAMAAIRADLWNGHGPSESGPSVAGNSAIAWPLSMLDE